MNELIRKSKELSREVVTALTQNYSNYDIYDVINDLEGFIENFKIKVFYSNMDGFDIPSQISGYSIVNAQGSPEIVINANDSLARQRFTMA
ncbi:toxin-antitoxin system toxin subunit, partial [Staphylococcus haemolyticus]